MTINRPITALIYPRGHCKQQTFYFRGDDIHKEPEFLDNELRAAKLDYEKARAELEEEKEKHEKVQFDLAKREGYTVALATALGDESCTTEDNARIRFEMQEVSEKIEKIEQAIEEIKSQQNPGLIASLSKEKAFYHAEIEDLRIGIYTGVDNIRNAKEEIADLVCSKQMVDATVLKSDRASFHKFYSQLRAEMDKLFGEFSEKQALGAKQRQKSIKLPPGFQVLIDKKDSAILEKEEAIRQQRFAQIRARLTTSHMLDQIESMNQALIALGAEPLDASELYEKYCNENQHESPMQSQQSSQQSSPNRSDTTMSRSRPSQKTWKSVPKPRSALARTTK